MKKLKYILALAFVFSLVTNSLAQTKPTVFYFKISDNIDPRTNRHSKLALEKAEELNADYVILELDTYGGALNDADEIRTRILNFEKPIYAYINKDAASAGALISIACDSIYMASGASIGAATVVTQDGATAPDKYQSYMRSIMRSTAEATGRNPKMAEAMVDEDIDLDSIATQGKVLTLSTSEAIKYHFCEAKTTGVADIMKRSGVESYELITYKKSATEKIISIFLNPFISGLLVLVIIGGLYFELQTPGVGFPILASIVATLLYFIPNYLGGLASNWEIVLFFVGIILIALEVFVIPGFGVAGILGLICTLGALILVTLNNDVFDFSFVSSDNVFIASATVITAFIGSLLLLFFGGVSLANSKAFKRLTLNDEQVTSDGFSASQMDSELVGRIGKAFTILRPGGKVEIDGNTHNACTRGEYLPEGADVEVIEIDGNILKVREKV